MSDQTETTSEPSLGARQKRAAELRAEVERRNGRRQQPQVVRDPGAETAVDEESAAANGTPQTPQAAPDNLPETGPVGDGEYVVKAGDCVASIAWERGHLWETIWDDAQNRALRTARHDPNLLRAGDRVHVPELRRKEEPGATEQRHRFQRRGLEQLRLVLRLEGEPRADEPYTLEIDGVKQAGTTDADGRITTRIAPDARCGVLTLTNGGETFDLALGALDPLTEYGGVQARLHNLGYDVEVTGEWNDQSAVALRLFQQRHELRPTGKIDELTRDALRAAYGC